MEIEFVAGVPGRWFDRQKEWAGRNERENVATAISEDNGVRLNKRCAGCVSTITHGLYTVDSCYRINYLNLRLVF